MKNLQIIVLSIFFLFNLWAAEEIPFEERILILDYPSMVELQLPKGLVLKRDKNVWSGEFDNTSFLFFIEASNGIAAPSFEQLIPKEFKIKEHDLDFYNIKPVQNNQWKGFQAQARQNKQGEFGLVLAVENEGLKIFILVSSRTAPPKTVFDRIFNSLFFFHVSNKINFYARGNEWELTLPYPMPYRFPYFYIKETVFVKLLPAMNEELFFVFHPEGSSEAAKWRYTEGQKYYQKHSPLESIGIRDEKLGLWTASIYKSMEKIPGQQRIHRIAVPVRMISSIGIGVRILGTDRNNRTLTPEKRSPHRLFRIIAHRIGIRRIFAVRAFPQIISDFLHPAHVFLFHRNKLSIVTGIAEGEELIIVIRIHREPKTELFFPTPAIRRPSRFPSLLQSRKKKRCKNCNN